MQKQKVLEKTGLSDKGSVIFFGVVCWVTYFSIYLGRLNFSASMSEMAQTGIWGKTQLGSVAAAFYLAYGLGQFPSGVLGDHFSGRKLVMLGLVGAALANAAFPFVESIKGMQVIWFINGLCQALVWPPMARLVADMTHGKQTVSIVLALSFTSPVGMLSAYLFSAVMLEKKGWQYSFWFAAIWLLAVAVFWFLSILKMEQRAGFIHRKAVRTAKPQEQQEREEAGKRILASGIRWIGVATFIHGVLKDGLTTWIPTYLTERFLIAPSFSVLLTTILPIVNLSGVYLADYTNRKIFKNETGTAAAGYAIAFLFLVTMITGIGSSVYGTVAVFAVVTSMMTAVNTVFISLLPIHFQKEGKVATVSGILNAVTYLGSAVASVLFGWTAEKAGWTGTEMVWCFCAATGMIVCLVVLKRWKNSRRDIYTGS